MSRESNDATNTNEPTSDDEGSEASTPSESQYSNNSDSESALNMSQPNEAAHSTYSETPNICVDCDDRIDSDDLLACKGPACDEKVRYLHCITLTLLLTYSSIICHVEACSNSPRGTGSVMQSAARMQLALHHVGSAVQEPRLLKSVSGWMIKR